NEPINTSTNNVWYSLNTTGYSDSCSNIDQVGANVYKCNWLPDRGAKDGFYNVTLYSSLTDYYDNQTTEPNLFYYFTEPLLKVANMTPRHDSWSTAHNFTVNITDNDGDTTNVTLWIKVGGTEQAYGMRCCGPNCAENTQNCSNLELNWTDITFPCSAHAGQTAFYWFSATDEEGYSYNTTVAQGDYSETQEPNTFAIEEADTNVTYISGNNSLATTTVAATFEVRVYDLDNLSRNFSTSFPLVRFYVENSSGGMQFVNESSTNETGFANVSFLPDEDFSSGNKTWYALVPASDTCYQYNITENLTVDIQVNWPPFYRNMLARDKPSSVSAGWGENWNFSVQVKDYTSEFDDINITLQVDSGSGWTDIETQECQSCSNWNYVNFTLINFTCNDINSSANYRFNLTDNNSNPNLTISKPIDIERDDVTFKIIWGGYGNVSNRSAAQIPLDLQIRARDENGSLLPAAVNVSFNITKVGVGGGASWDGGIWIETNVSGMANFSFIPTCDNISTPTENEEYEVGEHQWFVKVRDSEQCYQPSQSSTWNFTVIGTLYNTIDLPDGSTNYTTNESILMQGFINNYCNEPINTSTDNVWYSLNTTGYSDACSNVEQVGANVYKCTWLPDRGAKDGYYNVTLYSSLTDYYDNQTTAPNLFYYFTEPLLKVANMTPRHDSWSTSHNFTVNITDNDGDTTNVTLWIKVGGLEQSYGMRCCGQNCASNTQNCSNLELNWTSITFPCSAHAGQTAFYWFSATDEEGYSYNTTVAQGDYSETQEPNTFAIEEADTNVTYISGNNSYATRLIPTNFTVKVYDLDNLTRNFSTSFPLVRFYVENSSGGMQFINESYTNETGYANVTFLPTADFSSGNKTWYALVPTSDTCYQYNITENLTVELDVNFPPLYDDEKVRGVTSGASAGWGEYWYFNITVMDMEGDDVNISLYVDYGNGYDSMQNQTCINCNDWDIINFTVNFNCTHINDTAYYKFKMVDNNSAENINETTPHDFTIETDDINFTVILGHNSVANRSGNQTDTLIVLVNDTDRNITVEAGVNGTIWITDSGGVNWDDGYNVTTNSSGHWTYVFNASCNYSVDQQTWRIKSIDQCYDEVDTFYDLAKSYYLTVMGNLNVTLTLPTENNYTEGQNVYFLGDLRDDCGTLLSGFENYVTFRPWHGSYYEDLTASDFGGGIYDYLWGTSGKPGGWYNITMKAVEKDANTYYSDEKNYTYPNQTAPLHAFYLEIKPRLKEANVTPRQDGWAYLRNFTVNVSDEEVDNVTVQAWQRISGDPAWTKIDGDIQCQNCSNTTMEWNQSFTCSDLSGSPQQTRNFKFNATDNDANSYETSVVAGDYVGDDEDFIIERDDIEIYYYSGNESDVNRSGSDYALFILEINDTDRNQLAYNPDINVTFNITTNGTGSTEKNDGFNMSNSSGYVHYRFKPSCDYEVGKQEWEGFTGEDNCYKVNSSGTYNVTIYGSFLVDPEPGNASGIYYQDDIVKIYINITDDCYTSSSNVTVNVTLRYNASVNYTCGNVVQEAPGNYSCEWQSSQQDPTGKYDVITRAELPELYNNGTFTEDEVFTLLSYLNNNPALSNENVTPDGWGALTNFSVDVWDPDYGDNVTVEIWESSTGSDPWTKRDNYTCYYCDPGETVNMSTYHTCADANKTMYYKFNASDGQGGSDSTDTDSFTVQKDDVT
ncbi:MAG: hypothetical protein KAU24_04805, partial [Candidatus Aenigmarchaeota archaeon]|nr:hypothetical protein [Candidatus Aenigmarchaeota archaeon]